jgi:uncharacterized phage-like protein YoqJ
MNLMKLIVTLIESIPSLERLFIRLVEEHHKRWVERNKAQFLSSMEIAQNEQNVEELRKIIGRLLDE